MLGVIFAALGFVGFNILLLTIGRRLRGRRRLLFAACAGISISALILMMFLASSLMVGVFEFYNFGSGVACSTRPDCVNRQAAYALHRGEYIFWMALPPETRPSCDVLPELCILSPTYDEPLLGVIAGGVAALYCVVVIMVGAYILKRRTA